MLNAGAFPLRAVPDHAFFEDAWPDYGVVETVIINGPVSVSIMAMRPYLEITALRSTLSIASSRPTITITEA